MKRVTTLLTLAGMALALNVGRGADIIGTVTLQGTPPKEKDITPIMDDLNCKKLHTQMPTTHFYVVGPKGQLADVVVSLEGMDGQSTGVSAPAVELDQKGCEYVPQILAVQTGQKIIVKNSDPVMHNVHDVPTVTGNKEENRVQMPGTPDLTISFAKPEAFLKFKCDVHPWMFAWVSVFDHPYYAISAKDGTFKIANVKPGKYTIKAVHRKADGGRPLTKEIEVKEGAPTKVDFTMEVK